MSPNWTAPHGHLSRVREALADPQRASAAVAYYATSMTPTDRTAIVRPINVPTLAIYGADEPRARRDAFGRAELHLGPGSRVIELLGVGHWPHLERPNKVGRMVVDWFDATNRCLA